MFSSPGAKCQAQWTFLDDLNVSSRCELTHTHTHAHTHVHACTHRPEKGKKRRRIDGGIHASPPSLYRCYVTGLRRLELTTIPPPLSRRGSVNSTKLTRRTGDDEADSTGLDREYNTRCARIRSIAIAGSPPLISIDSGIFSFPDDIDRYRGEYRPRKESDDDNDLATSSARGILSGQQREGMIVGVLETKEDRFWMWRERRIWIRIVCGLGLWNIGGKIKNFWE